jgi:imidazolonepropionase-like amidohydrolase
MKHHNLNIKRTSMKHFILLTAIFLSAFATNAQVTPAPPQAGSILILNATAHLGNGETKINSAIGFEDGKLTYVGDAVTAKKEDFDQIIDATGKHIYPGIIAPNSTLGLHEIGAVRATDDDSEVGRYNPHARALIAYNTDSKITPTVRTNGVLMAQITPRGGLVSGTSSIVELDGWNWEDAVFKTDDAIHVNWPRMYAGGGWWAEPAPASVNKKYLETVKGLREFFELAKAYAETKNPVKKDLKMEAMRGVFDGTKKVYFHADYIKELTDLIFFARDFEVKPVLVGGYDAWFVADLLKENKIPVMLRRVHDLPMRAEEDVDLPYKMPAKLKAAGVQFCLQNAGDMEAMGARNLPFYAGTAAAYGLTKEEALTAITLSTAQILGIDNRVGSLEVGKDATLFISTGDALDMRTNNVEMAFIQGKSIELNNHQMELYEKYKKKYEGE